MNVWVVVGGQYGSEGKGKVAAHLAARERVRFCVRCGGPNSGHSLARPGAEPIVLRQLPTGVVADTPRLLIAPGALIDLDVLKAEIDRFQIDPGRLGVDRNCFVISERDKETERAAGLRQRVGSTLSGVGAATARRVSRAAGDGTVGAIATSIPWLEPLVTSVSEELNEGLDAGASALIEGTQGFGLSLYHTENYPYCTSRDTTAAAFLSEAGVAPGPHVKVALVLRTFPIRVPGNSGPLPRETTWEQIQADSGYPHPIHERTSVTRLVRRVGRFDIDAAKRACVVNRPALVVVNGLDYLSYSDNRAKCWDELSPKSATFLDMLRDQIPAPVALAGTGPGADELIDLGGDGAQRLWRAS